LKSVIKNILIILNEREKKKLIKFILLDVLISVLDVSFLALLLFVIHFYTEPQHFASKTNFSFNIFNQHPLLLVIFFFIFFSLKNLFGFLVFRTQTRFFYEVASRLSKKNLLDYLDGSFSNYIETDSSVHIRKISQHPIEFGHHILGGIHQIISQAILIIITTIAILIYNPVLFPLLLIILAPPIILTGLFMKRKLTAIRKTAKVTNEKLLQHLQEALAGFVESNIYGSREFFTNRYYAFQKKFNNFLADQQVIQNMPSRLIEVFAIFGLLILILINSITKNSSTISLITIGAFMAASYKIIPGIVKILNSLGQVRAYEFVVHDLLKSLHILTKKEKQNNTEIKSLEFANVFFRYKEKFVLNNFSFSVNKGDFIGLSGLSGVGKTTIINLLLGFFEPSSGIILFNKLPCVSAERQQYWGKISYVKQQGFFIYDSIIKNITLQENYDAKKLNEVIAATEIDKLINENPERENKIITENGKNISGGQRQRIAIARALYKNADVIILDEPFSELDNASEKCLLQYFRNLSSNGKTIVLITHNIESLTFCNKIIELDSN
jgi:ABC-type multidrug transport system fused ATPase/permease subunit